MSVDMEVHHTQEDKIKIVRGQKGFYGWEISVSGLEGVDLINKLKDLDKQLRQVFHPKPSEKEKVK